MIRFFLKITKLNLNVTSLLDFLAYLHVVPLQVAVQRVLMWLDQGSDSIYSRIMWLVFLIRALIPYEMLFCFKKIHQRLVLTSLKFRSITEQ